MKTLFNITIARPRLSVFLVQLVLTGGQIGCALQGTGTGNPNNANLGVPSDTVSELVARDSCTTVVRCHADAVYANCVAASAAQTTFTERLGLPVSTPMTLQDIEVAENSGRLHRNAVELGRCREQIELIDCRTREARESFDAQNLNPYARLSSLLQNSCTGVFQAP